MVSEIKNLSSSKAPISQVSNKISKEASKNNSSTNKETSNTIAYMIGATALATVIAVGVLYKKGKLGTKGQEILNGTSNKPSINPTVNSTIDNLSIEDKAKSALKDLYQKIIDKAKQSGNNKRVNCFEQCKNNIDNFDIKTVYGNLLDTLYKESRLSEYPTSNLITKDIDKITALSTPTTRVKDANGWHYRIPNSRHGNKTVDRVSVNALADEKLIKALDDLFASGKVKGYYKTPNQSLNWLERHDPITIYLDEAADKSTLDNIKSVCEKYIRSTDDVLIGDKFASGMALQKSPTKQDIEAILQQAKGIDSQLESVLRTQFTETSTGKLETSAEYIEAAKNLFDLVK